MASSKASKGRCRSCGASVWWCSTENGKPGIYQREPVTQGVRYSLKSGVAVRVTTEGQPGYESHFAHCPNAKKHRR